MKTVAAALDGRPLEAAAFARLMAPLGPFEDSPRIAVAVSGGPDSLALALLLHDWAKERGGRVVALTVDHGLRAESAAEAKSVGALLRRHGISQRVLTWEGEKPRRGIQAAARAARYRLLEAYCRNAGIVELALGHQRDDQLETLLLRLAAGSGPDGLAAMPAVARRGALRLLRPLLNLPRSRLEATLRARGLAWIEDPSNRDPRFARVALRRALPALAVSGPTTRDLAESVRRFGLARGRNEAEAARWLAASVALSPAGFALVEPELLAESAEAALARALANLCMTIGGRAQAPRAARLARALAKLRSDPLASFTLGGCRFQPWRGRLLVTREARALPTVGLAAGEPLLWDGRFEVSLGASAVRRRGGISVGPLGSGETRGLEKAVDGALWDAVPGAARGVLPAFRDRGGLLAVPSLGYFRTREAARGLSCVFRPIRPLSAGGFTVA